jgi:hypothetical protein
MSSKAPFLSALAFAGLLIWTSQTLVVDGTPGVFNLQAVQMALYGLMAIGCASYGVYLQRTGKKFVEPPKSSYIIWSVVSLIAIAAVGLVTIIWNGP